MTAKDAYRDFLTLVERQGAELNQFLVDIQPAVSVTEFDRIRYWVGQIMGNGHYDTFVEIAKERPDLKPAWLDRP